MTRKILASVLVLTITWTSVWGVAPAFARQPPSDSTDYEQAIADIDRTLALIEELRSHIDRSQFDLEALLDNLDYDADKIIQFVRNDIRFEQYPGLLRGATGTLMSRAGNALDQSVLLATLLRDAGLDARVLEGHLDSGQARNLLLSSFRPTGKLKPEFTSGSIASSLERFEQAHTRNSTAATRESSDPDFLDLAEADGLVESSQLTTGAIRQFLDREHIEFGGDSLIKDLETQTRFYYWVEYRSLGTQAWASVHPAYPENIGLPDSPPSKAIRFFDSEVPEDLLHKVGFNLEIEQRRGSELRSLPVMPMWERPSANLVGRILTFRNVPSSLASGRMQLPHQDTELFFPVFDRVPVGKAFDMAGNVIPTDEAASSYAALFQTVGSKMNQAGGILSSLGSSDADKSKTKRLTDLSAVNLQVTLSRPDGSKKEIHRTLFEADTDSSEKDTEQANDQFLDDFASITQNVSFAVLVGSTPLSQLVDGTLSALHSNLLVIKASLAMGTQEDLMKNLQDLLRSSQVADFALLGLDLGLGLNTQIEEPNTIAYRSEPGVVSHRWRSQKGSVLDTTVDILANSRTALRKDGSELKWAAEQLVSSGVFETYLERLMSPASFGDRTGTIDAISSSDPKLDEFSMIRTQADLDELQMEPDISRELRSDLEGGFLVLVSPELDGLGQGRHAWWRVHATTGETLGMVGPNLGGAVSTEWILKMITIGLFAWATIAAIEFDACYSDPSEGAEIEGPQLARICIACAGLTSTLWMAAVVSLILAVHTGGASEGAAAPTRLALMAQATALAAQLGCSYYSGLSD